MDPLQSLRKLLTSGWGAAAGVPLQQACWPRPLLHARLLTGLLTTTRMVLAAPLPRVEAGGGELVPASAGQQGGGGGVLLPALGGPDFSADGVAGACLEAGRALESRVLAPMESWLSDYNLVMVRAGEGRGGGEGAGDGWEGGRAAGMRRALSRAGACASQARACSCLGHQRRPGRPGGCRLLLQVRMKKLEKLRLEVDWRRRDVAKLMEKVREGLCGLRHDAGQATRVASPAL